MAWSKYLPSISYPVPDVSHLTGLMGDPFFDEYYASNFQFQSNTKVQETKMQAAGSALLNKIGLAVLISHSQGGLMPWVIADAVPKRHPAHVFSCSYQRYSTFTDSNSAQQWHRIWDLYHSGSTCTTVGEFQRYPCPAGD